MSDKSTTHQKVIKNGQEGFIHKEVWADMVKSGDRNGFEAMSSAPPEIEIIKKKKVKEDAADEAPLVDEELTAKKKK